MSYFPDLTPFTYRRSEADPDILNIGWISSEHPVSSAKPSDRFVAAMKKVFARPVNLCRGCHLCEFCPPPREILLPGGIRMLDAREEIRGNGEVWVKGRGGVTYVAPALALHYVVEHHYAPPEEFVDAVMASAEAL